MRLDPGTLPSDEVARRFDDVADRFAAADFVHRATCDGLIERLAPLAVDPRVVVDLGAAGGQGMLALARTWRRATIVGLDLSARMLAVAMRSRPLLSRRRLAAVRADARRVPCRTGSVDLVFANLLLPWLDDPSGCFAEVARVLQKGGVFAFATLGPDSFAALRGRLPLYGFPDMHDVGDALVRGGLADPVLDVDRLQLTFATTAGLAADLVACGAARAAPAELAASLDAAGGGPQWSLELELVYGHAWGAGPRTAAGEFRIEPAAIGRRPGR